jgi:hypothetical protein
MPVPSFDSKLNRVNFEVVCETAKGHLQILTIQTIQNNYPNVVIKVNFPEAQTVLKKNEALDLLTKRIMDLTFRAENVLEGLNHLAESLK